MALITWDEHYSVKIEEIDNHHRRLFQILNDFYQGLRANQVKESILKLINELYDYTNYHFQAEEKLMEQYGYPKLAEHRKIHQDFINRVQDYRDRFASGRLLISIEVTNFIRDWLVNHILKTDMEYSEYLTSRGAK